MSRAEELLACALTYREASRREASIPTSFDDVDAALATLQEVLLHEAREAMETPLEAAPPDPYLHPVDVETNDPGIVHERNHGVLRCAPDLPRVRYERAGALAPAVPLAPVEHKTLEEAEKRAATVRRAAQRAAATAVRREQKQEESKAARAAETPEEREERLRVAREKRKERKERRAAIEPSEEEAAPQKKKAPPPLSDDALLVSDISCAANVQRRMLPPRKRGTLTFYSHPLPHHRHLMGLAHSRPPEHMCGALLRGEESDDVEVVTGPPGTGKTAYLVRRMASLDGNVLLCAPTNVGAANLYAKCVAAGLGDEASLALAPERVPLGTVVLSNDASRRIVCATVSGRNGPALLSRSFDHVLLDEAAQCMEAWCWTLLRADVRTLVLAGDVRQLPAVTSESGTRLRHERSLMERLVVDLGYANVVTLRVQHRMAPELLRFPNEHFYDGQLTCGPGVPRVGTVEVMEVESAAEEAVGTSYRNRGEAEAVRSGFARDETVVVLTPYLAQAQLLLSYKPTCEVHTVDSFQGREAETVVLSVVRSGSSLGFWEDPRRLNVALTRARRRLVLVVSAERAWPAASLMRELCS